MPVVLSYATARSVQLETPTNGGAVIVDPNSNDVQLILTPASTLATMTLTFPDDNHSIIGEKVDVWTSAEITSLTCNGSTLIGGVPTPITINNAPNTILANEWKTFMRVGPLTWTGNS